MRNNSYWGTAVSGGEPLPYPITGFPATAYLGNNRGGVGVGNGQSQPSQLARGIGQTLQFNPTHQLIFLLVIGVIGYLLWHVENK